MLFGTAFTPLGGPTACPWLGAFAAGIDRVLAAQVVLVLLWWSDTLRNKALAVVPFVVAILLIQATAYVSGWLQGTGMGDVWHAYRLASHIITTISVVPTWFLAFYAIRPAIDARFRRREEAWLSRPRGWSIVGLMFATACFAIVIVGSIRSREWLERLAREPGYVIQLSAPLSLALLQFASTLLNALAIYLVAVGIFLPRGPRHSRISSWVKLIFLISLLAIVQVGMSIGFWAFSSPAIDYHADSILMSASSIMGMVFPHAWFFYCWKRVGYELDIVTAWPRKTQTQAPAPRE